MLLVACVMCVLALVCYMSTQLRCVRVQTAIVSQEPRLFDATIAENIRFGKQDATESEIELAAKAASIHKTIMKFKDGMVCTAVRSHHHSSSKGVHCLCLLL